MKLKTYTLGCKVNQYETEYMRGALHQLGYCDANESETADLVLVNTCTVTAQSDWKSRKAIRKFAKENPAAEIVVMGCFATRNPEEVASLPGVSELILDKRNIPDFLRKRGLIELPYGISTFGERHRAFVKVQDGCKVGCSYCIIPKIRPYLLSRSIESIRNEIHDLAKAGYAEIVLTGIHLGHFGVDLQPRSNLTELVREIVEYIEQKSLVLRIRVSSLEAVEVSDSLIQLFREHPRILCPHFHLSMQSGSDEVLLRMKRRWMSGPFLERCEKIQSLFDRPALTTDVIVGFPGETDHQFEETCHLVRQIGFSKVHLFRFSPRQGTEAATLPDQIPSKIKQERSAELNQIATGLRNQYAQSLIGQTVQVLFETDTLKGRMSGTADRYLQAVSIVPQDRLGTLVNVKIEQSQGEILFGSEIGQ